MKVFKITDAIVSLYPDANWNLFGDSYDGLDWLDTRYKKPTKKQIVDEVKRLQKEYNLAEYQRLRSPEYPSIGDQLDALYKAGVFPEEMAAQIQAVKDKYPKPE